MRATVVLLVLLGVGALAPAAQAERWAAQDQRGDVTSTTFDTGPAPEDDPCADVPEQPARGDAQRDLRRLVVDHTAQAVTVTMTMRELRPRGTATRWGVYLRTDRRDYELTVSRYRRGDDLDATLIEAPDYPDLSEVAGCEFVYASAVLPCGDLAVEADSVADRLVVSVPRQCLRRPRWVQVGVGVQSVTGPGAGGRLTINADHWGPRGSTYDDLVPPLSPRVRR